ncbi:DNA ligase-like protein [Quillaja saponaria]|uniref:DNA ligase-like protein n=2 Tax=Quillaja saponaria TaxID=32244 RepID=A0AAD7LZ19_QUISA|nr:DNA ligase-like protein [Quillaja saponaria]
MESDDDVKPLPLSPVYQRNLKLLKKATRVSEHSRPEPSSSDEEPFAHDTNSYDFETLDFGNSNGGDYEEMNLRSESGFQVFNDDIGPTSRIDHPKSIEDDGLVTKRALEFDSVADEIEGKGEARSAEMEIAEEIGNLRTEELEKKRRNLDGFSEKKAKKKKRVDETRDAAFNSVHLVEKPISSLLEKIRQRKLEGSKKDMAQDSAQAFRAPVDDTQELFSYSQTSDAKDGQQNEKPSSPLEEVFAPSIRAINLKSDSAPPDDVSSDEEENDKENIDPHLLGSAHLSSSPTCDPVKVFVNEEAEEEDDSENDLLCFLDNKEDDENDNAEELNDMIAIEYEEKPIDSERRNHLHQQWLEQQDAAGTDNLLEKLKCGLNLRKTTLFD